MVLLITHLPALLPQSTIQDEGVYVVVAREMLRGEQLYVNVVDRKPPLLFWVYEAILRISGTDNWFGLHLVGVLWVFATMALLYAAGRRVGGVAAGCAAAILYAVFQTFWEVTNLAFNGEVLMNLPVMLGVLITFLPSRSRWRPELLLAGAMPAIGCLLKQPAGIAAVPLGVYVLLPAYRRARGLGWRHSMVHAFWLCAGFIAVMAAAALVLERQGILREAFYWSVLDHDLSYGPFSAVFWARGSRMTLIFSACCAPLLLGAWWSLRRPALWQDHEPERVALLVFLAVTIVGTAASGRFFDYYYIQLLPPLCLLAAPWFGQPRENGHLSRPLRRSWIAVSVCAAVFLVVNLVEDPPPLGELPVGRYLRDHSRASDRMFVWGQNTTLYLQGNLRPATRYVAYFPLTGYIFGSPWNHDPTRENTDGRILPGAWSNLAQDFAAHPPRYILDTEGIQLAPKYPIGRFPVLAGLVSRDYRLVFTSSQGFLYERRGALNQRLTQRQGQELDGSGRSIFVDAPSAPERAGR